MDILGNLWGMIKAEFFYDFRSSVASIFLIFGLFFIYLLLKDNYEKLGKTLRNVVGAILCCVIAYALF